MKIIKLGRCGKLKICFKLANAYLNKQRGRTIALISSIMLAVILVFIFNVIPETKSNLEIKEAYKNYSDFHVEYNDLDKGTIEKLKSDKEVTEIYNLVNMGNIVDKNGISISLNSYDKDFIDEYGYKFIKGIQPKNENEIVLEEKALKEMGLSNKLGQTIDFTLVKKYVDTDNKNQIFSKNVKFKLVGIIQKPDGYYENNEIYQVKAFTIDQKNQKILPSDLIKYNGILKLDSKEPNSLKASQIAQKYNIESSKFVLNAQLTQVLSDYQMMKDTKFRKQNKMLPMIAATLVIYNIFNIILIDMTPQIGMLRAIGLSKKKIRLMLVIQSLIVLIIGLILGMFLGSIISYISLYFIYNEGISLYISEASILEPIKMSILAVFISSIVPIYKSGKVSPIEAIRYSDKISIKNKNRACHKLIRKVFGLTGEMAWKNVGRNKTRLILSVLTISLAGVLFIKTMALSNNNQLDNTHITVLSMGKNDINLNYNKKNTDENFVKYDQKYIEKVSRVNNIEKVNPSMYKHGFLKTDIMNITDDYKDSESIDETNKNLETTLVLKGYNNKTLKDLGMYIAKGNNIDKGIESEYPTALIVNNYFSLIQGTNSTKVLKDINVGDLIDIKIPTIKDGNLTYKTQVIRVSGILNKDYTVEQSGAFSEGFQVILNEKDFGEITGRKDYNEVSIKVKEGKDEFVQDKLEHIVGGKNFFNVESKLKYREYYNKQYEENNKIVMVTVCLILLISSINIFCIIRTNIMIRINELSTLRAIGMSLKKIRYMIVQESFIYGIIATLVSAVFATYIVYKDISISNTSFATSLGRSNTIHFKIPINYILEFGIITTLICIIAGVLATKKLKKISIIEGLKSRE